MVHLHENNLDQHLPHRTVELADDILDLRRGLIVGDDDNVVRIRVHGERGGADAAVVVVLAAAGAAAVVTVSAKAAKAAEAAEAAKATSTTPATSALLRVNVERDAEKKGQKAAHKFFELLYFHNLSWV